MLRQFGVALFTFSLSLQIFASQTEYPAITPENVMNLQEVEIIGQGSLYSSIAWSPDGSLIVAGGSRGIFIFDSNYQDIGFIDVGKPVNVLRFAPDGSFVYLAFDGKINAFDLETKTPRYQLESSSILAISQNGELVAYIGYRSVIVADVATGEMRYVLDYGDIWEADYEYEYGYQHFRFAFAQFYNNDEAILVHWMLESGDWDYQQVFNSSDFWTLSTNEHQNLRDIVLSNQNSNAFVAFDADANLFHIQRSERFYFELEEVANYDLYDNLLAMPLCEAAEYSCNPDSTIILNVKTMEIMLTLPMGGRNVFSPDGTKIAIDNEIFDLATGDRLAILQNDTYRVLSGVNDRILHYGEDDSLRLLDADTMEEIAILPMKRSDLREIREIFNDGSFLLVDHDGLHNIRVSGISGEKIADIVLQEALGCLHLSQNQRYFFCGYSSGNFVLVGIWNAETGERIEFPVHFVPLLANFDANQVVGWTGETIGFYDLISREYVEEISLPESSFEGQITAISMSNDGQYLSIYFNAEGFVIRRNTGEIITIFHGDAAFNPSSTLLAYSDGERNVWVMNLANNQIIYHWYVSSNMPIWGGLRFQSDEILNVYLGGPDGGNEVLSYDARTGSKRAPIYPQVQPLAVVPFAESNGLRFYDADGIRIEWNEQPISLKISPMNFSSAALNSDGNRLYINYTDGRVGIWAVAE